MPIKFRWPQDINAIRFGTTLVWGVVNGIITIIQGVSPLSLVNAVAGRIKSLVQYGKCTTVDDEIYCNNGKLVIVDDELPSGYKRLLGITFDGNFRYETGEALTGDDDVTMTLNNLSTSGKNVFGSYNGANSKNFSLYIYGSTSGSYFRFGDQLKRPKYGGTGQRTITFGKSGTSGFADDSDVTPDEFTTPANTYIGMLPNSSSAAFTGDIIGSITVSNRLEWIPCENPGGVIGYYEKYNRNFLEPVGSGSPVSLGYDTSHLTALSIEGTPEVLTIGTQTATVANLFSTGTVHDEQDIISGTVTRRCEAVISDGTTPSGRYIGEVGEGNIIVKVRETGYEGDVATFEATEAKPLNGLSVNVSPIQDLHGYDSPWPAGGGKNKFNPAEAQDNKWINNTTGEIESVSGFWITGFIPVKSGDVIRSAPKGSARNAWYNADKSQATYFAFNGEGSATAPSDGFVVLAVSSSTVAYGSDFIVTINNADLTFAPYSNICPISGRTSATVTRTGRNLFDINTIRTTVHGMTVTIDGQTVKVDGTSSASGRATLAEFQFPKAGTYHLHTSGDLLWLKAWNSLGADATVTVDDISVVYRLATATLTSGTEYHLTATENQIEIGSSFSAYEPYAGTTYTIILGDTVYGGSLDVTQGKMVVTHMLFNRNSATMNNSNAYPGWNDAGLKALGYTGSRSGMNTLLNIGSEFSYNCDGNNDILFFGAGAYHKTQEEWKALALDIQIVIPLVTPIEITLTPTQIETLLGQNNVWSDAGTVKAYVADGDLIEHVTAQPMRTAEGSNTIAVTSAVDPVQLSIEYYKDE